MRKIYLRFSLGSLLLFVLFAASVVAVYVRRNPWVIDRVEMPRAVIDGWLLSPKHNLFFRKLPQQQIEIVNLASGSVLRRFHCGVESFATSSTEKYFLLIDKSGSAKIFDAKDASDVCALPGKYDLLCRPEFSPDDRWVSIEDSSVCLRVFDCGAGGEVLNRVGEIQCKKNYSKVSPIKDFKFAPDCRHAAYKSGDNIYVYELATLSSKVIETEVSASAAFFGFSPDSKHLLVFKNHGNIIDLDGGVRATLLSENEAVTNAGFSPDGSFIYACAGSMLYIWHGTDYSLIDAISRSNGAATCTFSRDGTDGTQFIETDGASISRIWSTSPWRMTQTLPVPNGNHRPPGFSPDGREIWTYDEGVKSVWIKRFPDHHGGHFTRPEVWLAIITGIAWLVNLFRRRRTGAAISNKRQLTADK